MGTMISFWAVFAAFIGGGCVGVLVMALMSMAGGLPRQSTHVPRIKALEW
jgi:purine-cytosine permease-like protein